MKTTIHTLLLLLLPLLPHGTATQAQTLMRDLFAAAPDSIFPLLTKNNKLDLIDFKENNMQARVKNRLDETAELKLMTPTYLHMQMTSCSTMEMKLMGDSLICLIRTRKGPVADSQVTFYNLQWQPAGVRLVMPPVEAFWQPVPDSLAQQARFVRQSLQALPLVEVTAHADDETLTLTLQPGELDQEERKLANQYLKPVEWRLGE